MALDEFKEFVRTHPLLKDEVNKKERSWQNIYEEWKLFGNDDKSWKKYEEKKDVKGLEINKDSINNIINYVRKINPDNVTKTLNNVSKVVSLLQSFGLGAGANIASKVTGDPLFDKKFDDWY